VAVISSAQPRFRRISRLQNTKPTMKITKKTVLLVVVVSSDIPHGSPWWIASHGGLGLALGAKKITKPSIISDLRSQPGVFLPFPCKRHG